MTVIVVGKCADRDGAVCHTALAPGGDVGFHVQRTFACRPSTAYARSQPADIGCDVEHGRRIGSVRYLERQQRGLWAVAALDDWPPVDCVHFSPSIVSRGGTDFELRGLALTSSPASVGIGAVTFLAGSISDAANSVRDSHLRGLLTRADAYDKTRRHRHDVAHRIADPEADRPQPMGPGCWLVDGELTVEQRAVQTTDVDDRPSNATANVARRQFITAFPSIRRGKNLRLVWKREVVGVHRPEVGRAGVVVFEAVRNAAAAEALVLVADGVLDYARPLTRADGTTSVVELVP